MRDSYPTEPITLSRRIAYGVVFVGLVATAGCGSTDGGASPVPTIDGAPTVIYQCHDAPLAPDYSRSFALTIRRGSAEMEVSNSAGDMLLDVDVDIDEATWERTLDAALAFSGTDNVLSDGCVGGTADELTVLDGNDEPVLNVFVDNCDTGERPYLRSAVDEVLSLFDLESLLATGPDANDAS